MQKNVVLPLILFMLISCQISSSSDNEKLDVIIGAVPPPTGNQAERTAKLVNYFHWNFELQADESYEAYFAQWDMIILCPEWIVEQRNIDLNALRELNPDIIILAWIPLGQQPPTTHTIYGGIPPITTAEHWYCLRDNGLPVYSPWSEYMMNPYSDENGWPKYAAEFALEHYLRNGLYDGVMFDISSETAPSWFSSDGTCDIDGDGDTDQMDHLLYREGISKAFEIIRNERPESILIGNGGVPWESSNNLFYDYANGCMHENALGDEFGAETAKWDFLWNGLNGNLAPDSTEPLTRYHLIQTDLRMDRTMEEADELKSLSADDLRRMRLGLVTAMLQDTYFGFDRGDGLHGQLWWFSEYDVNLGEPLESVQSDLYAYDTFSREYTDGIIIANINYWDITVTFDQVMQDRTTGEINSEFTLPSLDGRIYTIVRESDQP